MATSTPSRTIGEFRFSGEVRPANPYVDLVKGDQTHEFDVKNLDTPYRFNGGLIPACELTPGNHDTLVATYRRCIEALCILDPDPYTHLRIDKATYTAPCSSTILRALEKTCEFQGIRFTSDEDESTSTRIDNLRRRISRFDNWHGEGRDAFDDFVRTACMRSELARNKYLDLCNEKLDFKCRQEVLDTVNHLGSGDTEQLLHRMREAIHIDEATGCVVCDEAKYQAFVRELIDEKTQIFAERITDLREKLIKRSRHIDKLLVTEPRDHIARRNRHLQPSDPFARPLTQAEADDIFERSITALHPPPMAVKLLQIALGNPYFTAVISNQDHVDHLRGRSLDKLHTAALDRKPEGCATGQCRDYGANLPRVPDAHTTAEELAHYAIGMIYKHGHKPFTSPQDPRRSQLSVAVLSDAQRNGVKRYKEDFELVGYALNATYAEVPAKVIAMMCAGKWDQIHDRYPAIERYMDEVLFKDTQHYIDNGSIPNYTPDTVALDAAHIIPPASLDRPSRSR